MRLGVLIFGQAGDPHIDRVGYYLRHLGVEVQVFDQYRDQASILFDRAPGRWSYADWLEDLDGAAVWSRVKLPFGEVREEFSDLFPPADAPVGPYQTRMYWRAEWQVFNRALLRKAYKFLSNARIVNLGVLTEDADCKPVQLEVAARLGLRIPFTVIGNSEATLDASFGEELLYKPLSTNPVAGTGVPMPAMLRKADVLAESRATVAPAIYQERIKKLREVRVNVAGDAVNVINIDSQRLNYAKLDWRLAQRRADIYSPGEIPDALKSKILAYMDEMKLDVAAFDFAVTPDSEFVFFECNPGGQWLWLEEFVELPIARDVATAIHRIALRAAETRVEKLTTPVSISA